MLILLWIFSILKMWLLTDFSENTVLSIMEYTLKTSVGLEEI